MHRFIKTRYTSFNRMLGHVLPPRTLNGSANVLPSGPKDHVKLFAGIRTRKGKNILNFSLSLSLSSFFRAPLSDCPKSGSRPYHLLLQHGHTQGAKSCHRASARTLCRSGSMPSLSSAAGGGSSNEAAYARCAAAANRPDQRATQALMADGWAASRPNLPPTSMPSTTSRQRRAPSSSGYVSRRLSLAAALTEWPGCTSARGWASTGETIVASSASWEPCHRGRPLATTSMRRSSPTGASPEVHVSQAHVPCNPRASFATHTGERMLEWEGSRCQHAGRAARGSGSDVARAAGAGGRVEGATPVVPRWQ